MNTNTQNVVEVKNTVPTATTATNQEATFKVECEISSKALNRMIGFTIGSVIMASSIVIYKTLRNKKR